MNLWNRQATLQINNKRYSFEDLDFSFEVPFEDSIQLQTATFTVHNLAPSTRRMIGKGDYVILNAGYEGDLGCVFSGGVDGCTHQRKGTDWVTKITAYTALEQWLGAGINKTYNRMITAESLVRDLLNIFGIEVGQFNLVKNNTYPRGRVCSGALRDVLQEIVVDECESRMLIRNEQLYINDPRWGIDTGYVLSTENGMLLNSSEVQKSVIPSPTTKNFDEEEKEKEAETEKKVCLLNHRIAPADIIQVRSELLNGRYLVTKGKHSGSRAGKWQTQIELLQA